MRKRVAEVYIVLFLLVAVAAFSLMLWSIDPKAMVGVWVGALAIIGFLWAAFEVGGG